MSSSVPNPGTRPVSGRGPGAVYEFREFRLDGARFELLRSGRPLPLERKPMELLLLLVSRQGHLVTRPEIAERLWSSEVFVDTEHGINTAIRKLRHLLHDDPDHPQFIQTVTGMGYRFVAPVTAVAPVLPAEDLPPPAQSTASRVWPRVLGGAGAVAVCIGLAWVGIALYRSHHRPPEIRYTQLTDFTDSAVAPAISPDGHMLAFIRGGGGFLISDQIYVKMLPDGEARRVTDDSRPKYGLAFSPDGAEIAYTVLDGPVFSTEEVSALGGESHLLLKNAAGLVWLDPQHLLFSRIRSGIHLGVVTATITGAGLREIYFPAHERGMAHYAFPSPDRRWALVVEMNGSGDWAPCRLVALQTQAASKPIGPAGGCTSAGWSPDGSWMYFSAAVQGQSHLWRQHFPDGAPQQLTFGPTEEEGIAVEPSGALITSVGVQQTAIWVHDGSSERPLSSEGEVMAEDSPPLWSPDGTILYYRLRREPDSGVELWRTFVDSGKSEAVLPGISMIDFDVSPDAKQVVYTAAAPDGSTQLWLARADRSSPPEKLGVSGARLPHFGVPGEILFQQTEGNTNYIEQIRLDGTHRSKVFPYPVAEFQGVSPGRRWVDAAVPAAPGTDLPSIMAIPLDGSPPRRVCASYCLLRWSTDGKFLFVPVDESSRTSPGRTLAIPAGADESLPDFPSGGIAPDSDPGIVPGATSVARPTIIPGKDPDHYAWVNTTVHRNLYRLSLH